VIEAIDHISTDRVTNVSSCGSRRRNADADMKTMNMKPRMAELKALMSTNSLGNTRAGTADSLRSRLMVIEGGAAV